MKTGRSILLLSAIVLMIGCAEKPPGVSVAPPEVIRQTIIKHPAPLLLVHAWATWCHPCREEFPELVRLANHYSSSDLTILLVSADDPADEDAVASFLTEYNSPVGSLISTTLDLAFMEALSTNWGGTLPASFFYADGELLAEWDGKRSYEEYVKQVDQLLNR